MPLSDTICRKIFAAGSSLANEESTFTNELAKLLETCNTLPVSTGHFLIFTYFGHHHNKPAITNRKYRLLQDLLRQGRPLVLIASVHPVGFGDYNPADPPDRSSDPAHTSAWASSERLYASPIRSAKALNLS